MPKPNDVPAEQERRARALREFQHALSEEDRVRAEAAAATSTRARTAVWLGASLADLAEVTGRSRQAARKRWPHLGTVQRRRQWLTGHVSDILHSTQLILEHENEFPDRLMEDLRQIFSTVTSALADTDPKVDDPTARWLLLEDLVKTHLRAVAHAKLPTSHSDQAEFARDGATGVVAHYDAVARQQDTDVS